MRWIALALAVTACGGVGSDDLSNCQAATRKLLDGMGCKLHWVSCMEQDGQPRCDFEAECPSGPTRNSNTCLEM